MLVDRTKGYAPVRVTQSAESATEAPSAEPTTAGGEPADPAERDLPAELRSLVGDPSACLQSAAGALPDSITFQVSATVTVNGVIGRLEVTGGGLPESAISCVEQRLSVARMRAPVPGAPRTVRAGISLTRQPETPAAP